MAYQQTIIQTMASEISYVPMNHIRSISEIKKTVLHAENDFSFKHVNQSDVQMIMESLSTRKAHSFHGIPAKLNPLRLFQQVNYNVS